MNDLFFRMEPLLNSSDEKKLRDVIRLDYNFCNILTWLEFSWPIIFFLVIYLFPRAETRFVPYRQTCLALYILIFKKC